MKCDQVRENLSSYIDEGLSAHERSAIEEHLPGCVDCKSELVTLTKMLDALHSMKQPAAPDLLPGIHRQLQRQPWWQELPRRFMAPWPASLPVHGMVVAAVAIIVVVIAGLPKFARQSASDRLQLASSRLQAESESVELDYLSRNEKMQRDIGEAFSKVAAKRDAVGVKVSAVLDKKSPTAIQGHLVHTPSASLTELQFADGAANTIASGKTFQVASAVPAKTNIEEPSRSRLLSQEIVGGDRVDYYEAGFELTKNRLTKAGVGRITGPALAEPVMRREIEESNIRLAQALAVPAELSLKASILSDNQPKAEESAYRYDDLSDAVETKSVDTPANIQAVTADFNTQWIVTDREAAFIKVAVWVEAHHGTLSVEGDRYLRIQLAGADVDAFLEQFSIQDKLKEKSQILADGRIAREVMMADEESLYTEQDADIEKFGSIGHRFNKDSQVSILLEVITEE